VSGLDLSVWWISLVSGLITFAGSLILFMGSPLDTTGAATYGGDKDAMKKRNLALFRRKKFSKIGFGLMVVGFIIQVISITIQYPK
jgi:hypothetical protein